MLGYQGVWDGMTRLVKHSVGLVKGKDVTLPTISRTSQL